MLERKYGAEKAKKRIYVTTDPKHGALRQMATEEGYESFIIPPNVGGRYSVLTAVGLLPMARCGHRPDGRYARRGPRPQGAGHPLV